MREFAPSLVLARATLLPFEHLIVGESAGPQAGEDCEPYFAVQVAEDGMVVEFKVTADSVTASELGLDEDGEVELDSWKTTLRGLWDYLRQRPLPASAFRRKT